MRWKITPLRKFSPNHFKVLFPLCPDHPPDPQFSLRSQKATPPRLPAGFRNHRFNQNMGKNKRPCLAEGMKGMLTPQLTLCLLPTLLAYTQKKLHADAYMGFRRPRFGLRTIPIAPPVLNISGVFHMGQAATRCTKPKTAAARRDYVGSDSLRYSSLSQV